MLCIETHNKGNILRYNDSDYDKIGGTGVTVEVYMMADKYTAISSVKDLERVRISEDTTVTTPSSTNWPRMRVVIVHHYAALIEDSMFFDASNYTNYSSPTVLRLPYDANTGKWNLAHNWLEYEHASVPLPLTQANDTYKSGDVIFYEVAVEKDKNGDTKYTVYNDQKLTAVKGINYVDPDDEYLRLEKTTDPAKYFTYFMQHTTTPEYRNTKVKTGEGQSVYLDPKDNNFVALVVTKDTPTPPYAASGYYYVEGIEIRCLKEQDALLWGMEPIQVKAKVVNVLAGTQKVEDVDLQFTVAQSVERDSAGNVTYPNAIYAIGGVKLQNPIKVVPDTITILDATTLGLKSTSAVAKTMADKTYGPGQDTVYKVVNDTYVIPNAHVLFYDNGVQVDFDPAANIYVLADEDGNPVFDLSNKSFIYYVQHNGKNYIVSHRDPRTMTTKAAKYDAEIKAQISADFKDDGWYYAYSDLEHLMSHDSYIITDPAAITPIPLKVPLGTTVSPANPTIPFDMLHQFVRFTEDAYGNRVLSTKYINGTPSGTGATFVYDLMKKTAYAAYDKDAVTNYNVTSGILVQNGSNSVVVSVGTKQTNVFVNESTMLYTYIGTKVGTGATTTDRKYEDLQFRGVYRYQEFDQFGTKDSAPYVLVVCDPKKSYDVAVAIVVICNDAKAHALNNTYYGIYCGFDEINGSTHLYFIDARDGSWHDVVSTFPVDQKTLRNKVGVLVTVDESTGKYTGFETEASRQTLVSYNADRAVTKYVDSKGNTTYNQYPLDKAVYYYVGGNYISNASSANLAVNATVSVHTTWDNKVIVVIYGDDYLASLKDGAPYYGNIAPDWGSRVDNLNP